MKERGSAPSKPCPPEVHSIEVEVDEVMIVTITYDHEARRRSYELLAQVFGLESEGESRS